ncbi:excisionase [Pantoea agglomerans]|uniref:excisionase n=1 Tax=Enterobacter agglomerans TaxID=549 RepID=UPI003C7D3332
MQGISIVTLSKWVSECRLKAYRKGNNLKSPYLFTREDCLAALQAVTASPYKHERVQRIKSEKDQNLVRKNETSEKLHDLLKIRTKRRAST